MNDIFLVWSSRQPLIFFLSRVFDGMEKFSYCINFLKGFIYFLNENLPVIPSFSSFYIKGSVGRLKESQPEFTACQWEAGTITKAGKFLEWDF